VPSVSMLLSSSCERSPEPTHAEAFGQSPVIRFSGVVTAVSRRLPNHHLQHVYEGSSEEKATR
jgi:hypothetical protein